MPDTPRPEAADERLFSGYSGRMFLVLTLGLATAKFGRYVLPTLLPTIIVDLDISPFRAGVALSVMTVLFALSQFPSGRLADGLSRRTIVTLSLLVLFVGFAVLSVTPTYGVFLLGAVVVGAGEGIYGPASRALLSDLFFQRRGRAFGLHMTSIDLSGLLAAGMSVVVLAVATWRAAFVPLLAAVVVVLALLQLWNDEPLALGWVDLEVGETAARLFSNARMRVFIVAYALFAFVVNGVIGFLPTLLQVDHGLSSTEASSVFAVLFAVGIVVRPVAGQLSDRVPRAYVAAGALFLGAIGISTFLTAESIPLLVAGVVVFGVGQKSFAPVMQARLMDVFPDASMGGDLGAIRTVYLAVGSLGPTYVGVVAGTVSYTTAFAGFVGCFLVAGGILLWLAVTG